MFDFHEIAPGLYTLRGSRDPITKDELVAAILTASLSPSDLDAIDYFYN